MQSDDLSDDDLLKRIALARLIGEINVPLPDGREAVIYMQIMGTARMIVGLPGSAAGDDAY